MSPPVLLQSIVAKSVIFRETVSEFESHFCPLVVVSTLGVYFLIYKLELMIIVPTQSVVVKFK